MSVCAASRPSARDAEPVADVLHSGAEGPPWRPTRRQVRSAAGALAGAGLAAAALLVPPWLAGPAPAGAGAQTLPLVLRDGTVVLRRDAAPEQGRVRGGVHVEVQNAGRRALRLTSAALVPGQWAVSVVEDAGDAAEPSGEGRFLRPGWSAVLVLHRLVDCTPGAEHGHAPTRLVLEADVDGRRLSRAIDVGPGSSGYRGGLDDALGAPAAFCAVSASSGPAATTGDPGQDFVRLIDPA